MFMGLLDGRSQRLVYVLSLLHFYRTPLKRPAVFTHVHTSLPLRHRRDHRPRRTRIRNRRPRLIPLLPINPHETHPHR